MLDLHSVDPGVLQSGERNIVYPSEPPFRQRVELKKIEEEKIYKLFLDV